MRLFRYFLILVVGSAMGAGAWVGWQSMTKESPTASFRESLRLPQYLPESLEWRKAGGTTPDEVNIAAGISLPFLIIRWETVRTPDISSNQPSEKPAYDVPYIGILLGLVDTEMDMDMGGERTPIEVDGVQGWLTRLGPDEFVKPKGREEILAQLREWKFDRKIYISISSERAGGPTNRLLGRAMALQWNRDGVHYVLIAQDKDPMNKDELLKMANSMAPSEWPFPSFSRPNLQ